MAFDLSTLSAEFKLLMCLQPYFIYQKVRLEAVKLNKGARKRPVTQARASVVFAVRDALIELEREVFSLRAVPATSWRAAYCN